MKKDTIKNLFVAMALLAFAASFASCNKGYGCPQNFKVLKNAVELVK